MRERPLLSCTLLSAAVLVLLPWGLLGFASADAAMLYVILLTWAVDPVWCIVMGLYAGRRPRALWPVPFICAGFFLVGFLAGTNTIDSAFLVWGAVYGGICAAFLFLSWFLHRRGGTQTA